MKYRLLLLKRTVEDIVMFPLILLGRLMARARPCKREYDVFYFFPFYHTGGAEKIHALLVQTTATRNALVVFTRKSHNATFLSQFQQAGCRVRDISAYTDNKWLYFVNIIVRGIVSGYINGQKRKTVVFNGQCNFAYKLSPWLKQDVEQIELIHSLNTFSYIRIPFLPFISKTVMISQQKIAEHRQLYLRYGIPEIFNGRIYYIPNTSDFGSFSMAEKDLSTTVVLYSGRATAEKRPHLVAAIAAEVHRQDPSVEFVMAGDAFTALQHPANNFIRFRGNIADSKALQALYRAANILLITSATEGFPLAVIEGMAYGCAIIATPVGDIPVHVAHGKNGFVLSTVEDEQAIIAEGARFILSLKKDKEWHKTIAANNIAYAQHTFALEKFADAYKKLIYS